MMGTLYETDVVAWACEQAALLRSGRLAELDVINLAEEIEDVARAQRHELKHRISVLLAHLLKWKFQPDRRGRSWRSTIKLQRDEIHDALGEMPSLKNLFESEHWLASVWRNGITLAEADTKQSFPTSWIWSVEEVLDSNFWPD